MGARDRSVTAKGVSLGAFNVLTKPDVASTKRIAWAYGCAKKDSTEETQLYAILEARFAEILSNGGEDPR